MKTRKKLLTIGVWLFFFAGFLFILLAVRYMANMETVSGLAAITYLSISTLGHFVALSFLLFLTLYTPVILIFPYQRVAWVWSSMIITLGCCFLIVDASVFKLYHFHINRFVLQLLFGKSANQVFEFHFRQYLLASLVFVGMSILVGFLVRYFFRIMESRPFRKGKYIALTFIVMGITSQLWHAWADANNYTPITRLSRNYPLFFPLTAKRFMQKAGLVNEAASKRNLALASTMGSYGLNYPRTPIVRDSIAAKENLIMILIDSWYYKAFDSVTMPNVYSFSKQCELYTNHYSGSNGTRTGVFSLFYGIPGTYWDDVLATHTSPVLVDEALNNQYQIKTFTSASLLNPPFDRTVFSRVGDIKSETAGSHSYDRDNQLTLNWTSISENYRPQLAGTPVFAFLFYDALHAIAHPPNYHGPFQPEWEYAKYEQLDNDTDPTLFLNLYKNAAHYTDSLVGNVLMDLKNKGLLENSWVIITGDHGQEFNDNKKNYWGHNGNYTKAQMQVPFLLYKPGKKPQRFTHWTSHYDVAPTIMADLFHCKNPSSDFSIGKHLHDQANRDWLLVGSNDSFAIIQPDKITSIYQDRSFDLTDARLNPLDASAMDTGLINEIVLLSNAFRKK